MPTVHAQAYKSALKANEDARRLFARLGVSMSTRGVVVVAYRQARRALDDVQSTRALVDTLVDLRAQVESGVRAVLVDAVTQSETRAERELALLDVPFVPRLDERGQTAGDTLVDTSVESVLAPLDEQVRRIRAMASVGTLDKSLVLGDEARVGLLSPAPVLKAGAVMLATIMASSFASSLSSSLRSAGESRDEYAKQAIAAIDERTTDCCLRVTGQVVPLDGKFHLTGEPRFADELDSPPFHWWCRTAVALVHVKQVDDSLTREIRDAARAERDARDTTKAREEIHPAHATSRRGTQ